MTGRLDIIAPATLTVLAGTAGVSSLGAVPPGGITVSDPNSGGMVVVQVIAAQAGAAVSASAAGGATVSSNGATLSVTGSAAQVSAALSSLNVTEVNGVTSDTLSLIASGPGALTDVTAIAVNVAPAAGPAFVNPATLVTIAPGTLDSLPFFFLSDPAAAGLTQAGLGRTEALNLTLAVGAGILLLPGYANNSAISAAGLGTGTIVLSFTADQIGTLNTLLAGLEFAGPAGGEELSFGLRVPGSVPPLTYGNVYLNIVGPGGGAGTLSAGSQTIIEGGETLSGTSLINGRLSVLGNIQGNGAVIVTPDASLELPYNAMFLGGTSLDFGTLAATTLVETGTFIAPADAAFAGPVLLGPGGVISFDGTFTANAAEMQAGQLALSLSAGAVITGAGTLFAGNFSESGLINGPGTILAEPGQTLAIAAESITGGAQLEAAGGGVLELGPVSPLFGIFNTTPVTIDPSVTLSFLANPAGAGITGAFAGSIGGTGGAFVISGPQAFNGTVTGFLPGDQLIFPSLTDLSIFNNLTQDSFSVSGLDALGSMVTYVFQAPIPAGYAVAQGFDAEGDPTVFLRPLSATISQAVPFEASSGIAQPLQGLDVEIINPTTPALTLTLAVRHGVLTDGSFTPGAKLILTEPNLAALNNALGALSYTGTGVFDALTMSSGAGILTGLLQTAPILVAAPGVINGYAGVAPSEGEVITFGTLAGLQMNTAPLAPGEVAVSGTADFLNLVQAHGVSGTAWVVDGGGLALIDAPAQVMLGGDVTIGDGSGPGTLAIVTDAFSTSGNVTLATAAGGAGSAIYLPGALTAAGTVDVGQAASASLLFEGTLAAGAVNLGTAGLIAGYAGGMANLGNVVDGGTLVLNDAVLATASAVTAAGTLSLGGTASLAVSGAVVTTGTVTLGADNGLTAASLISTGTIWNAGTIALSGQASFNGGGTFNLAGGTLLAAGITNARGALLRGNGVLSGASLLNDGVLEALGGVLEVSGSLTDNAAADIASNAALDIIGSFGGTGGVSFLGANALLTVNDPQNFAGPVSGFLGTDAIDLVGAAPSLVNFAAGVVSETDALGSLVTSFSLSAAGPVSIVSDGFAGALITVAGELPCFARGTRLLTPQGYRAVEDLKPGDPVITRAGAKRPVRWIGRRTLDLAAQAAAQARPVLIKPGAFGAGQPARPLRLSPLHGVFVGGVLVPAAHLVNGATILRERTAVAMTYYHVELDRHDVLLADGLACESYLDTGNRGALYEEAGRRCPARRAIAPTVTAGPRLAAIRRQLHARAQILGFSTTYWPRLRAKSGDETVLPEITRMDEERRALFRFANPVRQMELICETACPAETDPDSEDWRELGVCLAPSISVRPVAGYFPPAPGDQGIWLGRVSTLALAHPQTEVTLRLAAVICSWARPVDAALA